MKAHPKKGSAEARAWSKRMALARAGKSKIRRAGLRTEKQFFGPGGVFAQAGHTKHLKNPQTWEYQDGRGVWQTGTMEKYLDHGGSDHTAFMRRSTGELDLVSGSRLKAMKLVKENPKGDYTGILKLPTYIDRAVAAVLRDGPNVLDWEWDRRMSQENKTHFHNFLVSVHHPLAYQAGTPEQRFKRFIISYVMPRIEKNPGEEWHEGMRDVAERYYKGSKEPLERAMFKGIEVAHRDSAKAARRLGMNRPGRVRRNPIGVFALANPPASVRANIEGVIYSRCLEIRAEKTKFKPGLYKHPFNRDSGVQVLALDNGDLLIHSTRGVNLWEPM